MSDVLITTDSPYNPTSLGKGDGTNFFAKRLPFGFAQDSRSPTIVNGDEYTGETIPGTVNTYDYSWAISMTCGDINNVIRAPGTPVTRQSFVATTVRPAPFLTAAKMATFCNSCKDTFQDESCLDHAGVYHPLLSSRAQGRWLFAAAEEIETPLGTEQITFPPPSGAGRTHTPGECATQPNQDGAN